MSLKTNMTGFGTKGAGERPVTFAESLLTGRPMRRIQHREPPKLKARARPRFGRKSLAESFSVKVNRSIKQRGSWFWIGLMIAVILAALALSDPELGSRLSEPSPFAIVAGVTSDMPMRMG